ncbi:MAG: hypothetical protein IPJ88_08235 [Myxococcales bacterium]|nr:MAG: hypothetical protein IPJ88_08235 [Myxococcales bacterium]
MTLTPRLRWALAFAMLCFVPLASNAQAQSKRPSTGFSAKERKALKLGKNVCRSYTRRQAQLKLVGGTCWQRIARPADELWQILNHPKHYVRWLPALKSAKLLRTRGKTKLLYFQHEHGLFSGGYATNLSYDSSKKEVSFKVDPSIKGVLRAGFGYFTLRPIDATHCLLSYGILADLGSGIIAGVLRPVVHTWMLRVPRELKRYAESRRRRRH